MAEFFQELRKIQKKERGNPNSLAKVDTNFYHKVYSYIYDLREKVANDPFSKENYLLKDTQRIATEIFERREHKIADAAIRNIHRSYHLFKGKGEFDLVDTLPLNLSPEEEKLYYTIIDNFKNYRNHISINLKDNEDSSSFNNEEASSFNNEANTEDSLNDYHEDEVINRLNKISNAQILEDEKRESIEKQVINSKIKNSKDISNLNNPLKKNNIKDQPNKSQTLSQDNSSQDKKIHKSKEVSNKSKMSSSSLNNENKQLNNILKSVDEQFIDLKEEDFIDTKTIMNNLEENTLVIVFKDFNQFIGVDEKIYGPFKAQDLVVMPKINANVIVKNRKGRILSNII